MEELSLETVAAIFDWPQFLQEADAFAGAAALLAGRAVLSSLPARACVHAAASRGCVCCLALLPHRMHAVCSALGVSHALSCPLAVASCVAPCQAWPPRRGPSCWQCLEIWRRRGRTRRGAHSSCRCRASACACMRRCRSRSGSRHRHYRAACHSSSDAPALTRSCTRAASALAARPAACRAVRRLLASDDVAVASENTVLVALAAWADAHARREGGAVSFTHCGLGARELAELVRVALLLRPCACACARAWHVEHMHRCMRTRMQCSCMQSTRHVHGLTAALAGCCLLPLLLAACRTGAAAAPVACVHGQHAQAAAHHGRRGNARRAHGRG